jgi:opacity protein-like surface antigen
MWKVLRLLSLLPLALAIPALAQEWNLGIATGPFVFGNFARRTQFITNGDVAVTTHSTLSAATRAGLAVDFGHEINSSYGWRLEATFTEAPQRLKGSGGSGVNLDAGQLKVTTVALPLVVNLNRNGAFRFSLFGGPAYAMYHINDSTRIGAPARTFEGSRNSWGIAGGAGVAWWLTDRLAAEGRIEDIVTQSPFKKSDFGGSGSVQILKPQNVHTTVGIRYRF